MEKKEIISYRLSVKEALDIVKEKLHADFEFQSDYEFHGWNNEIPAEMLDGDSIGIMFKKVDI